MLYGGVTNTQETVSTTTGVQSEMLNRFLDVLREHGQSANGTRLVHSSAFEEVEQEREVEFQVEEVREMQKPCHYRPHAFPGTHPAITCFVITGILAGAAGYEPAFEA